MNPVRILIVLCTSLSLWTACTSSDEKRILLSDAVRIIDTKPQEALALLEGIPPKFLYEYDEEQYLHYIVLLTQALHMNKQNITADSLILTALRHFVAKQDYELMTRASYYSAVYWYEKQIDTMATKYWLTALDFAGQAGNDLFVAKSTHWLGQHYYEQGKWANAIIYCQKALELCSKLPDSTDYTLDINEKLGKACWWMRKFEQADICFNKGLETAKILNNKIYESRFLQNKGLVCLETKEYRQAKEYFDRALSKQSATADTLSTYLGYAGLYAKTNKPDSSMYYLSQVLNRIPEITNPYELQSLYRELSNYYLFFGDDISETLYYMRMEDEQEAPIFDLKIEGIKQGIKPWLERSEPYKKMKAEEYLRKSDVILIPIFILVPLTLFMGYHWHELMERCKRVREKWIFRTLCRKHALLNGLRIAAESSDDLYRRRLAFDEWPDWVEVQVLREELCNRIAESVQTEMEKQQQSETASTGLTREDLCIIYMSHFKLSDKTTGWLLGRRYKTHKYIRSQKSRIRQIQVKLGIKNRKKIL